MRKERSVQIPDSSNKKNVETEDTMNADTTPANVKRFFAPVMNQAKRLRWAFVFLFVVMAYMFAETRYPALNYDDTYHIGNHFPQIEQYDFSGRAHYLFCDYNSMHNEFRTYGLARTIYFGLYQFFGTDLRYYYGVMAVMASLLALFAAFTTKLVTNSRATAVAVAGCCLLGPFALFQTFWHAAYILFPLMVIAAYLALHAGCTTGRSRQVLGGLMCVLVTMTGEVATMILLAAIGILAVWAKHNNDNARLRNLLVEFSTIVAVLFVLYIFYRLKIFNPELASRFSVQKTITFSSIIVALREFNMTILSIFTSSNAITVIRSGVHIDYTVTIVIALATLITIMSIVCATETESGCSVRPALFLIALYITSFLIYVAVASRSGIYYPPRYLHASGFLLTIAGCLGAASVGSKTRKLILVLLVCISGAGGILTFGIKVPTVEAASEFLRKEIITARANGGTRVMFIAPPKATGFIKNPHHLEPAASALTEWWILENYCPMIWGVPCAHGASGGPGDIIITATPIRDGFMPALDVTMGQASTPAISPVDGVASN